MDNDAKKLDKLERIFKEVDKDFLEIDEAAKAIAAVVSLIKEIEARVFAEIELNQSQVSLEDEKLLSRIREVESRIRNVIANAKENQKTLFEFKGEIESIKGEIKNVLNSIPPQQDLTVFSTQLREIEAKIPVVSEVSAEQVRDKLESLEDNERLSIDAIHNLTEELQEIKKEIKKKVVYVPAGAGSSTSSGTWSSLTVDGNTTDFSVADAPTEVNADGIIMFGQNGYTWSGGTLSFINPPQLFAGYR